MIYVRKVRKVDFVSVKWAPRPPRFDRPIACLLPRPSCSDGPVFSKCEKATQTGRLVNRDEKSACSTTESELKNLTCSLLVVPPQVSSLITAPTQMLRSKGVNRPNGRPARLVTGTFATQPPRRCPMSRKRSEAEN